MNIRLGDVGITLVMVVSDSAGVVDISGATTLELILQPPKGAGPTKVVTAAFDTTGVDGAIAYVTTAGIFDAPGAWSVFAHVVGPAPLDARSSSAVLLVEDVPLP
jgi:hypothetical protein